MTALTVERLGHLGDGIAEGPVFAARTLPGEVIEGDVVGNRIAAPRIITPSPDRVRPSCPHYKACGGCALQHASDEFVASWKRGIVEAALAAHGLPAPIRRHHTSPEASRRRATFSARRTKKGVQVGFHAPASDVVTAVPNCRVLHPDLIGALGIVEACALIGGSRKGEIKARLTRTDTGLDLDIAGGKPLDVDMRMDLAVLAERHDLARLTWDGEQVAVRRTPVLIFGTAPVPLPPGAFLQATPQGQAALVASVRDAVQGADRIVDLFAGCGTFALSLADMAEVHAVEGDAALVGALDAGWRHAKMAKKVTTAVRDLFRRPLLADELSGFDAAVIDPPRAGAEEQAAALATARIPRIASVSCNPVTFARDTKMLVDAGYVLDWIDVVDQFRWSTHVELVASLSRADP